MNQTSKKPVIDFKPGSLVTGKWHKNRYVIKRRLGQGAIGSVYLCERNGKQAALKISDKGSSVTVEVNVLKTFQKVQGNRLGPSLLDVDDWVDEKGNQFSFYVMEYLKGSQLSVFLHNHGEEWLGIFMLQLLDDLAGLHSQGWVFGDLKSENLIVTYPPARLRWIDVGGTTQIGRSIKEYTEFYDRGYWNMGSRKAEPSYDLFALAMVVIQFYHPKRFDRGSTPRKTLMDKVDKTSQLKKYQPCIYKALTGKYSSSEEMKNELTTLIMNQTNQVKQTRSVNQGNFKQTKQANNYKDNNEHPFLESLGIFVVVILFYFLYLLLI